MKLPSIKFTGSVLFLLPVLAVVIAFTLVASWQGRRLADELAGRVMDQATARIEVSVNSYLRNAVLVTDHVSRLIAEKKLDPKQLREWKTVLHRELAVNDSINSVTFGTPTGEATWMIRYPNEPGMEYAIRDDKTKDKIVEHRIGTNGSLGEKLGSYKYDPRVRPWYKAAVKAGNPTWTKPYAWVRGNGGDSTLGIAFARPIKDRQGELVGVLDSDIGLVDVSLFLKEARVLNSGESILVGRDGKLLATSLNVPVVGPNGTLVDVNSADNALITDVAEKVGDFGKIGSPRRLLVDSGGKNYRVEIRPLNNPWGLDWRVAVIVPDAEIMAGVATLRKQVWWIGGAIALGALALGVLLSWSLVRPVTELADAVRQIGDGNLDQKVEVGGHQEFVQLSDELNRMTEALKDRMRLRQSLTLAMEIQQKLLPSNAPKLDGLEIAGHSTYCDETGGDYYDFIDVGETNSHELMIVLGDVMGHGVAAALLMATARGILRSRAGEEGSLGQWLTHLNQLLVEDTGGERFMTMVLLIVHPIQRTVRLACAGHDLPIVHNPQDDHFSELPDVGGLPLGLIASEEYIESKQQGFTPGQILLVGTDGLWESENSQGEPYGKDRLREVIRSNSAKSAQEIATAINADLDGFRGEARQEDDITFVLVKFTELAKDPHDRKQEVITTRNG